MTTPVGMPDGMKTQDNTFAITACGTCRQTAFKRISADVCECATHGCGRRQRLIEFHAQQPEGM